MLPDVKAALIARLTADPRMDGATVAGQLLGRPCVVVTRAGGGPDYPEYLDQARMSIDVYSPDEGVASTYARTALQVLTESTWTTDQIVVTRAETISSPIDLNDPDTQDHHYTATIAVSAFLPA